MVSDKMKIKKMSGKMTLVLAIILIVAGVLFYHNFIKIGNVFDQMYYARVRTSYNWFGGNRVTLEPRGLFAILAPPIGLLRAI